MKKLLSLLLCGLMLFASVLPVYAANGGNDPIVPYMNNANRYQHTFAVSSSGEAMVKVDYVGKESAFTSITVETYIQKKTLGLFWTKVDNGEANNTWVDTSTALSGTFTHSLQLENTGEYRAVFKITFSGTGGADDVIEKTLTYTYE